LSSAAPFFCALFVTLAFGAAPAQAHQIHPLLASFGSFSNPTGAAVDNSTGGPSSEDVYIVDSGKNLVDKFDPAGNLIGTINGSSTPAGSFSNPLWDAVDPKTGNLYVADSGHKVVDEFNDEGGYVGQISGAKTPQGSFVPAGVAVDPNHGPHGYLYVSSREGCPTEEAEHCPVDQFDLSTGEYLSQFEAEDPTYLTDGVGHHIKNNLPISSLAVDLVGNVWVADRFNVIGYDSAGTKIGTLSWVEAHLDGIAFDRSTAEFYAGERSEIHQYDSSTNTIGIFGNAFANGIHGYAVGLGVNESTHSVYVALEGSTTAYIFARLLLPDATTGPATEVEPHSAVLSGTVDSGGGGNASCRFEYVDQASFAEQGGYAGPATVSLPCSTATVKGAEGIVAETTAPSPISGLTDNTTYHYRIVGEDAQGESPGADLSFKTLQAVVLSTGQAEPVTPVSASLHATINPAGDATTVCHFEYFPQAEPANLTSVPCPAFDTSAAESVEVHADTGVLLPETPYSFQIVGSNTQGSDNGGLKGFTTPPAIKSLSSGGASAITSSTATLSGSLDPDNLAPTSCYFDYGPSLAYGSTAPVPAPGEDIGSTAAGVRPFTSNLTGLIPNAVYHFRIACANPDGTTLGKDRIFVTLPAAPLVSVGEATEPTRTTALLHGTLNPKNAATAYHFAYVADAAYEPEAPNPYAAGAISPERSLPASLTDQPLSELLKGLSAATTYHFTLIAEGPGGTVTTSDRTFTTAEALPPQAITGEASAIGLTTATLNATVIPNGLPTSYQFELGTTTAYGTTVAGSAGEGGQAQSVALAMANLAPATTYHFRVVAHNQDGSAAGADRSFTTASFPVAALPAAPSLKPVAVGPPHSKKKHHKKKRHHKRSAAMRGASR
jgi:hypothetical protein